MILSRAYIIIGLLAVLLLVSCGQQYQAKSLVKDFVKEHAAEEIDITSFSDLDSTKVISDSLLQAIRQRALSDPLFKDVQLPPVPAHTTLFYIRMRYGEDSLNMSKTFYFTPDLEAIIAFK